MNSPSPWVERWSHLLAPGTTVLDVACGPGRHLAWFAGRGHAVTGVDQDIERARQQVPSAELVCADIEAGAWPLQRDGQMRTFGAVVVTNYLWRPLLDNIVGSVAPGGILLYETFAAGNEAFGRPSRPDFLLQPGELLRACTAMDVVAYEHGYLPDPPRMVQRIAALKPAADGARPPESKRIAL
ncbi:bifunctional 2-polyprenyl-6-hydroxyphenol methylase/3-demethylubiquinol 3-O-methyltransferase UbiG [Rhodoferax sp. AJA081-3]|uniref:class I SAM-dependent methyltransferase n=1 Tax=Rhodoferax sp. AJA081-3 TaxID=2752316 RepID=UPI001FD770DF|nr:class I SAM-dependent methyltransferase [Rhodoferax sp. AJA081-3]